MAKRSCIRIPALKDALLTDEFFIGYKFDLDQEKMLRHCKSFGGQFHLDMVGKGFTSFEGGMIVLNGNPSDVLADFNETCDECFSQHAFSLMITMFHYSHHDKTNPRRCFFVAAHNVSDARRLSGHECCLIQPVSYRGSLFPHLPLPYRVHPGLFRKPRNGVTHVCVNRQGDLLEPSSDPSAKLFFEMPNGNLSPDRITIHVPYPRHPLWCAMFEKNMVLSPTPRVRKVPFLLTCSPTCRLPVS